ncbi:MULTISPECIES: TraR/DksA family transcriptional regulator [Streptomyces]|uniref:TraR/DksA family transcriptional regulator n=1 Tax=Streptomyces thermoviolaceus subsp. thermoviolaceus TaxID=66860 RepID=A0ABX0YQ44_STRTL|nr:MULTISPECIES: TraR/DksA family transcriptional regulator [Streptomyces]MCM3265286.1 TraR/DksA family transcriptional regulator [Streptomyces thermoviolaceus]NJP14529.1 TraR/DksA family transcriptional regulator [Streptomyces thermoviolaceus subsp. thermoviolaceus]RSS05234.1 TraR/DksA family transcriptional regulator [Streptomyces sp. WAC00469]WTD49603.1 TraR/DksA family transcriptional regulator [Streptomyces thermoviolaceus]GGV62047.1 DNA-binding protein [Streptomyces thermoviolaceus subsp
MVAKKTAEQSASGRTRTSGAAGTPSGSRDATATGRKAADAGAGTSARGPAASRASERGAQPGPTAAADAAGRAAGRKSTAKKAGAARAAKKTGATTVGAKKTPGTAAAATTAAPEVRAAQAVEPGDLPVRPGEDPWTAEEVEESRAGLRAEAERLRAEITSAEVSLVGLMRDSGDGAGDDQADTGTKNITREHEMALAANAREMLVQIERALQRLDAGTYGLCENCGDAIGKARMQAFPRATLCVQCKQKQERRY